MRARAGLACVAGVLAGVAALAPGQQYQIQVIVDDQGLPVQGAAIAINDAGTVAGISFGPGLPYRGFRSYANGAFEWLDPPAGIIPNFVNIPTINASGSAAGGVRDAATGRLYPVIWDPDGIPHIVPLDAGLGGWVTSINDFGHAVGFASERQSLTPQQDRCVSMDPGLEFGFRWSPSGGVEVVPGEPTVDCVFTLPLSINNNGDIAGRVNVNQTIGDDDKDVVTTGNGFVDTAEGTRVLFQPEMALLQPTSAQVLQVTDSGYVLGTRAQSDGLTTSGTSVFVAVVNGPLRDLIDEDPDHEGIVNNSVSLGFLNNMGEGLLIQDAGLSAFLWRAAGPPIDLRTAIGPAGDAYRFTTPGGTNTAREIVANAVLTESASETRILRLIPQPPSDCPADINNDGVLTGADFNAFLTAFSAMDPAADQNNDGVFTGADFNAFLTNFSAGCD